VGTKVDDHRGAFVLSYPMEHGVVTDWDDMERLWDHIYAKENLNVKSEEHVVGHAYILVYVTFEMCVSVCVCVCSMCV
jgi:actin-related protein